MRYFGRYWIWFASGSVFLVATSVLGLMIPRQLGAAVELLRVASEAGAPVDMAAIGSLAWLVVALAVGACVARIVSRVLIFYAGRLIEYDVRNELFGSLTRLDPAWYQRQSTGDLTSRIINDVNNVRVLYGFSTLNLVNTAVTYTVVLSLMFSVSPRLTWLSLAPYPIIILTMRLFTRALYLRTHAAQERLSDISTHAQEAIAGVAVVRAFGMERVISERFRAAGDRYVDANLRLAVVRGALFPFVASIGSIGGLIILYAGGRMVIGASITLGEFVEFSAYITALAWPTAGLGWALTVWQRGTASFDRLMHILATRPAVADGEDTLAPARLHDDAFRQPVTFEDVGLVWEDGTEALRGVTLTLPAGSVTAVVGRTGAGKSSLVSLLARLRDPTSGVIRVGDVPLTRFPLRRLRASIGYVPQDPLLFSRSIRENIRFGELARQHDARGENGERAGAGRLRLEDATRIAHLDEAVTSFADGLETLVGERGVTLSGGQKQRVTIARAVLLDPDILVLDDALSSVDTETERTILEELLTIMEGRTTVLVTHRFNALHLVDQVVVLDEGQVVEQGTHHELLARGGVYAQMVERQQLEEALSA